MSRSAVNSDTTRRRLLLGAAGALGAGVTGALGLPGSASAAGSAAAATGTVYIASDSTAQTYSSGYHPQAGWGQKLSSYFTSRITVANRAIGGRSSRSFIEQGRLAAIQAVIRPGDYLFVQFGHNDATVGNAERYTPPPTTRSTCATTTSVRPVRWARLPSW